jgi:hypothetical protein
MLAMGTKKLSKFSKVVMLCLFIVVLATPRAAYAGYDNGVGNGGENNGHHGEGNNGNGNGNGGSVPINGSLVLLAVTGVAYGAKKFYDLKHNRTVA